ncbi:hypothetical protein ACH4MJ_31180 [Streptomyces anulatus]
MAPGGGQGPLDHGVRGRDPAVPSERRRQDDVGEPHQAGTVLHEGGLGLGTSC